MTEQPRTLVCFGDSNTYGSAPMNHLEDIRRHRADERWPGVLAAELGPAWHVIEEALPGRTTVHPDPIEGAHLSGIAAVPIVIGSHSPIDTVVMMLGVNDLKARFSVTPHDIGASIEALVASIRSWSDRPGRTIPNVLVIAPPPITEIGCLAGMFVGGSVKSAALGPILRKSATKLKAGFIDAGDYVRSSDIDGIHFDVDQHRILGELIANYLTVPPRR